MLICDEFLELIDRIPIEVFKRSNDWSAKELREAINFAEKERNEIQNQ